MFNIQHHHHHYHHLDPAFERALEFLTITLISNTETIMTALDNMNTNLADLKDAVIGTVSNMDAIKADLDKLIAANPNGIDPADVQAVADTIAQETAALRTATAADQPPAPPTPPTPPV